MIDVPTEMTPMDRARAFHEANPHVYEELRRLALILRRRGHEHFGCKMLIEQMRWLWMEQTTDVAGFKLNNNYAAFYARLLMDNEPELAGVFALRAVHDEPARLIRRKSK